MTYSVIEGSFDSLRDSWKALLPSCATNTIFVTPRWQEIWWEHFRTQREMRLLAVQQNGVVAGIAPLTIMDGQVSLLGSTDVCDYLDFVLPAEHCTGGLSAVFDHLETLSWSTVVLHSIPGDSPTLSAVRSIAQQRGFCLTQEQEDVCPRADLPGDWDSYLAGLSKKDRHELRRKLRRLEGAGQVCYYTAADPAAFDRDLDDFLRLMRSSAQEKADFMTPEMERFFRAAVDAQVKRGVAKLQFLEIDGARAAAVLCFDYQGDRLLYNSGYDFAYAPLSVGLLLKAYAIRDAIDQGMRRFDFLRGNEPYKYDLGGVDYPIYHCTITRS